jgi:L-alanine-DL-glutamate epimerase-like enolase superfamily enzyme
MIETFHPDLFESTLRSCLTGPEAVVVDGVLPLPSLPGLGVAVDEAIVDRYRIP